MLDLRERIIGMMAIMRVTENIIASIENKDYVADPFLDLTELFNDRPATVPEEVIDPGDNADQDQPLNLSVDQDPIEDSACEAFSHLDILPARCSDEICPHK